MSPVLRWTFPNVDWFGSDSADREEERANYQQQACCEPNMASRKRKAARRAEPRRGHVLRSLRTFTFCELPTSLISTA